MSDISVGLSSGTMIIPQAMAYAFLAGMPPIYGMFNNHFIKNYNMTRT